MTRAVMKMVVFSMKNLPHNLNLRVWQVEVFFCNVIFKCYCILASTNKMLNM